jgi:hypothetical protein
MKKIRLYIALVMSLIVLAAAVFAHGNVLYDITLDFDKDLKKGIISAAQKHLNINEQPTKLDYDYELISVKFGDKLEHSVLVHPSDFSIFGFRDDSLVNRNGDINFNEQQRNDIALDIFNNIPESYQAELKYSGEKKLYAGSFEHTWYRYKNKILVMSDHLKVEIDPTKGSIVAWRLSPFFYRQEELNEVPAISWQTAQKIAELRFKGQSLDTKPVLIFVRNELLWLTKIKGLYPFFVGVNAHTGEVEFSGNPRGELPNDYDYGRDVEVVPSKLIKEIYGDINE